MMNMINRFPEASKKCVYSVSVCITYAPEKYAFVNKYGVTRAEVREIVRKYRDRYAEITISAYYMDKTLRTCYEYKNYMVVTSYIRHALHDNEARTTAKDMAMKYHSIYNSYRTHFLNDTMLFYADKTGVYNI